MHQTQNMLLFSGTAHPALAEEIAKQLGISLGRLHLERFPDGETSLQIIDSVRGRDVFVVQPVALDPNNYLVELLIIVDALKRASARNIVAVIPYYGYCRQDRKDKPRVPITAKLVANLLMQAGVTRVLTMDLHAGQVQGFFDIPVDNLFARPALTSAVEAMKPKELIVVTPDLGSLKIARSFASHMHVDFAVIDKHRKDPTQVEVVNVIGDVKGKDVLLADDICSTGATIVSAAKACQGKGARRIFAAVTHGLFVGDSVEKIEASPIEKLFTSNTIPQTDRTKGSKKIQYISVAPLFAKAISCILSAESISSLLE